MFAIFSKLSIVEIILIFEENDFLNGLTYWIVNLRKVLGGLKLYYQRALKKKYLNKVKIKNVAKKMFDFLYFVVKLYVIVVNKEENNIIIKFV